jgi:CheY-like chemotaxis protein
LTFLKNLSYEIRSPMNGILGFSELLTQPGISEEQIKEYTSLIRNKGRYLYTLIDDVIEISQFELGKINFTKSLVKLQPILNELFEEFESQRKKYKNDNITFVMSVPEDSEDQLIYTDAGRLHQLLWNLLSNALKFTSKGRIEFGYKLSEKFIKFYVSDTGPGLSKKDKQKIFNRFEEMEKKSLQKYSGTGLSLTISKHIVEQMGGKIKVKSKLNEGSRFQISIPLKTPEIDESPEIIEENKINKLNWKNKVILIAEDDDVNFQFLDAIMQMTNAKVLRAKNGQEAIDLCRNISQIDIVLMDLKMPVLSGYDAIIEIKRIRTSLPIMVQTAYASKNEILQSRNIGADDFIPKPIDLNLLLTKMEKLFDH